MDGSLVSHTLTPFTDHLVGSVARTIFLLKGIPFCVRKRCKCQAIECNFKLLTLFCRKVIEHSFFLKPVSLFSQFELKDNCQIHITFFSMAFIGYCQCVSSSCPINPFPVKDLLKEGGSHVKCPYDL